jgi:hypothetical protein
MTGHRTHGQYASYRFLFFILAGAFLLRLTWWLYAAPVVSQDGAEYLCAARNLVRGNGYVGCYEGPELMYAPLYPVLIAAISPVVKNLETGAHVISLAFGVLLIVPIFLIASLMYGKRAACISAILTALYPVFIKLAGSTFNEAPYVTLFMAGNLCRVANTRVPQPEVWCADRRLLRAGLPGKTGGLRIPCLLCNGHLDRCGH